MSNVTSFIFTTTSGGAYDSSTAANATTVKGQIGAHGPYLLYAVEWVDDTLADNVTAVLSMTNTPSGVDTTLLTLSAGEADNDVWYYPQVLICDNGATATTLYTNQVVTGQLKLVVASGGATKSGKCFVYLTEL